jgi:hypothetical protein
VTRAIALLLLTLTASACGSAPVTLRVSVPVGLASGDYLRLAVFEDIACSAVANPVPFADALVSSSADPADFSSDNRREVTVHAVPAGDRRTVVAAVIGAAGERCRACQEGVAFVDDQETKVSLILVGCD